MLGSGPLEPKYIDQASPCFPKKNCKPKNSLHYSRVHFWPWFPTSPNSLMAKRGVDFTVWPNVMELSGDQTKPVTALSELMEEGDTTFLLWLQSFFALSLGDDRSFKLYWFINYMEFVLFCKWKKQKQNLVRGNLALLIGLMVFYGWVHQHKSVSPQSN